MLKKSFLVMIFMILSFAGLQNSHAGVIVVVGDVNATGPGNMPLYDNVLGAGTNVLFTRGVGQQAGLFNYYNSLAGVTATSTIAPITNALLAGVDLITIAGSFQQVLDYTTAEMNVIMNFLTSGGSLLMLTEAANVTSYNEFLSTIGSNIQYTGQRFVVLDVVNPVEVTSITGGVSQFTADAYNTLSGGTAVAITPNGTVVAFENTTTTVPLPEPAPLALLGLGLMGLVIARRRRAQ
ncbi:MAG: PEP-CTERM sorting domain-containing protein [Emcibacter sp.]|nr:PEP-CTERM sorting domain-containing protein [Emcibacter sp.]